MVQVEANRISPTPQKFDFDSVKLLIETKDNLDSLQEHVAYGLCCIQFCGLELYKYELTHAFDILHINNKVAFNSIPPAVTSFKSLKDLCSILLATRNEWISLQRIIILAKNSPKAAYPNPSMITPARKERKKRKAKGTEGVEGVNRAKAW
ncbi:hypothetical protein RMATCC62417_08574 [Rhizopus microsporus]|nr:hypothetical protein RMATCC62417_08574 [Rhizopus microsporus]